MIESYLLALASLVLVGGSLGDLYGRRRIFVIGVAGFGAASLVCAARERAAAIGSWTAGTSAAVAIGPPLGGLLVDALSWRVIFAMNVPLVLVCLGLIARAA